MENHAQNSRNITRMLKDWSSEGRENWLHEVFRLMLGPLAALTQSGSLSGGQVAELVARAVVPIPLVTGAIAMRNYVKSER